MRTISSGQSNFIPDRGPARYFHGRAKILDDFQELLQYASQKTWGTTFLVQGAPGAGKSALLYECEKLAEAAGWKVAEVDPPAFWDVDELRRALGLRKEINFDGDAARVSVPGIAGAEVKAGRSSQTVKGLLQKGKAPLLLILDEAQALGNKSRLNADLGDTQSVCSKRSIMVGWENRSSSWQRVWGRQCSPSGRLRFRGLHRNVLWN